MSLGEVFPQILQAARLGEEWAWRALYEDLAPAVLGYLRARGAPEPEDLTGEVFLHLVRTLDAFDGDERGFRAWTFAIAHNRLVDDARRRTRRPAEPAAPDVLVAWGPVGDAEHEALAGVATTEVMALTARLSPDQRDVFLLRVIGDLSVDETASALGKSPGAVKQLQRRALAALKREISEKAITP